MLIFLGFLSNAKSTQNKSLCMCRKISWQSDAVAAAEANIDCTFCDQTYVVGVACKNINKLTQNRRPHKITRSCTSGAGAMYT